MDDCRLEGREVGAATASSAEKEIDDCGGDEEAACE